MEFCIGQALQTCFPEEFRELMIADSHASHFRVLKLDGWLPQSSFYGFSEELYFECIGQNFEQIEAELEIANSINNPKLEAAVRKLLLRQLAEELKKIKK